MRENVWQERGAKVFCILVGVGAVWVLVRYAAAPTVVVLIAWVVAATVSPVASRAAKRTGLPQRLWAVILVLLLFAGITALLSLCAVRLWRELERLFFWMTENRERLTLALEGAVAAWEQILGRVPFFEKTATGTTGVLSGWLDGIMASLGSALAGGVGNAAKRLPRTVFLSVVSVMACLYFSMDYERMMRALRERLPPSLSRRVDALCRQGAVAVRGYVRAYLLLMGMTFGEVFLGLLILGQPYACLIALGVAVVDILPVLGAGAVLLPWGILLLAVGRSSVGVGILILYGVVTIVRQIAEPRLIGGSLGLPPFVSLMSMVFGFWLFGVFGMLLGPCVALAAKALFAQEPLNANGES